MKKNHNTLIIIPVLNEENNISPVIDKITKELNDVDILIVNDGSSDKTLEILKNKNVFVLSHIFNLGIGASFESGCKFALLNGYEYIVRMDGDGQHDPKFVNAMLKPIKDQTADITIGSRFIGESEFRSSKARLIGIGIISFILYILTRQKVTDPTSGFCAMNQKAFEFFSKNCPEDYPEPEIIIYHKYFRIKEIPISANKRQEGYSSITPLKSIYYMVKVMLSIFMHVFRKEIK